MFASFLRVGHEIGNAEGDQYEENTGNDYDSQDDFMIKHIVHGR